ncbi:CIC11C00000002582 [Sungouiella intermedia]|uniref:CIC11C00000000268 n=1 Tax=Sungouiella intermedia TaxID=45354 RepID=A0A1L0D6Z4_9ASCO|nr:CIC11C00000002582 [[Candida] intermedia]SGZ52183.1 CIC11C00000000268 [[Candida] intermedia]
MPPAMEESFLENIKHFVPSHYQLLPTSIWSRLPVVRRASVFILLFMGQFGELRVVLTKRSSRLRNFPGHISLPGGKADTAQELPWQVSRREMSEEIGLSEDNDLLLKNYGFTIDHVAELPCYLSRTFSAVRPCIGFMKFDPKLSEPDLLHNLKLRVNPGESSSIFSCPLRDFLFPASDELPREALERTHYLVKWGGIPWHLRSYTFLQTNDKEVSWLRGFDDLSASEISEGEESVDEVEKRAQTPPLGKECSHTKRRKKDLSSWGKLGSRRDSTTNERIYDVWGLTANILHDLSEVVYLGKSKNNRQLGEEELIWSIWHHGNQMRKKERSEAESRLISLTPTDTVSFGEVLPRTEFNRLKRLYKI